MSLHLAFTSMLSCKINELSQDVKMQKFAGVNKHKFYSIVSVTITHILLLMLIYAKRITLPLYVSQETS